MDEFELEVTDLRAASGAPVPPLEEALLTPEMERPFAPGAGGAADGDLPLLWGRRSLPAHRRVLAGVVGSAALLVAVAVIISATPGGIAIMGRMFPTPTPLPPGAGVFLVKHYAPWGTLRIDGRTVPLVYEALRPDPQENPLVTSFVLRPGRHTLEYRAAPFPTLRCQVSVPFAPSDSCPLLYPGTEDSVQGLAVARILDLQAGLDRLAPDQYAALLAAIQTTLDAASSSAAVLPGEAYQAADGTVAVARQQLVGTFLARLNQDASRPSPPIGPSCVALCQGVQTSDLTPPSWSIFAHVVMGWRYATPDGQVLIPYAPAAPPAAGGGDDRMMTLRVYWDGGWRVLLQQDQFSNPTCDLLTATLYALLGVSGPPIPTFAGTNLAQGCAIYTSYLGTGSTTEQAIFLYQFGVVLAANAGAHSALPRLPLADARQQALALQLYAAGNAWVRNEPVGSVSDCLPSPSPSWADLRGFNRWLALVRWRECAIY
jgi:hypothetical protein